MRKQIRAFLIVLLMAGLCGCSQVGGERNTGGILPNGERNADGASADGETAAESAENKEETENTQKEDVSGEFTVSSEGSGTETEMNENNFYVKANGVTFTAVFADNSSAEALKELLTEGDISVLMHDYGEFEKVGDLGTDLPGNDTRITTEPGDVILYQGNRITVYYDVNSWNFTRLGRIEDTSKDELLAVFGEGDVTVTFSLNGAQDAFRGL